MLLLQTQCLYVVFSHIVVQLGTPDANMQKTTYLGEFMSRLSSAGGVQLARVLQEGTETLPAAWALCESSHFL